ncbi:MAG: BPTI/Kunitz domain-containing protein [Labilithrix sp.]|nr:BPTI/Kunitz domain-containing protein [Labilithrix sp.]
MTRSLRLTLPLAVLLGALAACRGGAETPTVGASDPGAGARDDGAVRGAADGGSSAPAGDRCTLPKVTGPCEAAFRSYWFNAATGKCEAFSYGGCEGNANRFETPSECVEACAPSAEVDPCAAIVCAEGKECVYQGATPVCAEPCEDGSTCSEAPMLSCTCAGSCANCKDCRQVCLP